MGKQGKKKGGKKDPTEQPSQSSDSVTEQPSTSAPPEEEEDVGLTGGARKKRKEKKEKALQALQALQAARKPTTSVSEVPIESSETSESSSRAQSEAPSESLPKAESEKPPEAPKESVAEVVEEFDGLGLTGSKKKKPKKKKPEPTPVVPAAPQAAPAVVPSTQPKTELPSPGAVSVQLTSPGPVSVQLPTPAAPPGFPSSASALEVVHTQEPVKSTPPAAWGRTDAQSAGRGRDTQSAGRGRGRGWGSMPTGPAPMAGASGSFPAQALPQSTPQLSPQLPPQPTPQLTQQTRQVTPQPTPQPAPQPTPQPAPQPDSYIHIGSQQPPSSAARPARSLEPVLCKYKIPLKIPGRTVRAKQISVIVNYLRMDFKPLCISRYDVSFSPDRPKKMIPEIFLKVKQKHYPKDLIAFDQMKNCYSLHPLKNVPLNGRFHTKVEITDQNGKCMSFEVSIKATGVVDLGNIKRYMINSGSSLCQPTEEIQCIDVILRQGTLESYVKAGRQFFRRPKIPVDLGYGYEMWTGLFQSAIFTNMAFINIDVAHKGFPKAQSLVEALQRDFRLDPTKPLDRQMGAEYFINFVKGLKVVATLVGDTPSSGHRREFICNSMVDPPDKLVFSITDSDGCSRKTTVADYFRKEKRYNLRYPNLNCLWVGPRDRCIYFPLELLDVAYGQPLNRQLNEVQVSKMVKEAATPPDVRLMKIKEVISNMSYSQNRDFKQFGLEISEKFYQVKAKILDPPTLDVGMGQKAYPRKGQWQAPKLLKPEPLQSWGLIAVDADTRNNYEAMISMIKSTAASMGMAVSPPKIVNVNASMRNLHSVLSNACKDVKLLFVVMSVRGRDDYHKVKQMAEREIGILTQCIKEMTCRRMNPMTAKNILLKVNSKLMGVNQAIDTSNLPKCIKDGSVMIVGADVTHPSPEQSNVPSIAAVTASLDPKCYIYHIELSVQTPKKEVIVEFEDMMFDHLRIYKERNDNKLPRKIFVFRDGVSEGQFAEVMNHELQAVHNAYERMAGRNKRPEVLFLLVQKRHHTRLFNEGDSIGYNVSPGTVVDTDIVHASELDFYLVSHQAIKGTARPTRYHAVCNDGKIPDDEVEQLTYYLCHLYSRCMRSVSYPTPTYYAHLACLRARSLTHGEKFDNRELERKPKRLHVLDKMLQFSRMFFV